MREVLLRTLQGQADAGEEATVGVITKTKFTAVTADDGLCRT
jgi:hypothetical protein